MITAESIGAPKCEHYYCLGEQGRYYIYNQSLLDVGDNRPLSQGSNINEYSI